MEDKKWLIIGIIIISVLFILKINNMFVLNILLFIWIFGTLFMPYIIGIAISVIIIFLIKKKINEKNKNSKVFIYIIIMIVCIIACTGLLYPIMQYLSEKPDKVYSKMKELNDSEKLILSIKGRNVFMIEIKFNKENNKSVAYDNNTQIGECVFIRNKNNWNIIHTEVSNLYQGRGIARRLVECVVENAKKYNKKVIADCSYAKRIVDAK